MLNRPLVQPIQFRIGHLLVATAVLAAVFAFARILGLPGTLFTLAITYFFGPVIAFGLSRYGKTQTIRYRIAAVVLIGMICVAYSVFAILVSPVLAFKVVPGTACSWMPQIAMLYLIHDAWKSGLRSAGVEPYATRNSKAVANHRMQQSGGGDVADSGDSTPAAR